MAARETDAAYTPGQARFQATLANSSDAEAGKIAHDMAYASSAITYDISHGDIRLGSTGQVVGDDYVACFSKLAGAVDAQ